MNIRFFDVLGFWTFGGFGRPGFLELDVRLFFTFWNLDFRGLDVGALFWTFGVFGHSWFRIGR